MSVRCSCDCFTNRNFTGYPECMFAAPYGFGALFFFQCGDMRSSEWRAKNSLTLLFKRTVSRLFIQYQNCGYKTNGFQPHHFHKVYRGISSSSIDDSCAPLLQVLILPKSCISTNRIPNMFLDGCLTVGPTSAAMVIPLTYLTAFYYDV